MSSMNDDKSIKSILEYKYKNVDSKGKLKGTLFTKILDNINETINEANTEKVKTKEQKSITGGEQNVRIFRGYCANYDY